jgi:ABC-type transporter MlaC component
MNKSEFQVLLNVQKDADYLKKSYDTLKKNYSNQYVAIKDGKVVAHNKNIDVILKLLRSKKINPSNVLIEFLHPTDMVLIL